MIDDSINGQLSQAEGELVTLDGAFSKFCQTVQDSRGIVGWLVSELNLSSTNRPDEAVADASRAIGSSIKTLHDTFDGACGGAPVDWETWWSLAKDCETQMGTVSRYNNQYGNVGGRLDVTAGEAKKTAGEAIDDIKQQLPSKTEFYAGVGIFVVVLVLILAIKLS